jgi:hypothetical protein
MMRELRAGGGRRAAGGQLSEWKKKDKNNNLSEGVANLWLLTSEGSFSPGRRGFQTRP